jgi:hypothetical protein
MNYAGHDYVMGHLLRFARQSGRDTLTIDFVKGQAGPQELLGAPISEVPFRYVEFFWDLVQRHGSDRSLVRDASLTLRFDTKVERPVRTNPELIESPFSCDVKITDIRGIGYGAHFDGWWFPEKLYPPQPANNFGLKIWKRLFG